MDEVADILLTFPPDLRDEALMAQGEDIMDQLRADLAAQARALAARTAGARGNLDDAPGAETRPRPAPSHGPGRPGRVVVAQHPGLRR